MIFFSLCYQENWLFPSLALLPAPTSLQTCNLPPELHGLCSLFFFIIIDLSETKDFIFVCKIMKGNRFLQRAVPHSQDFPAGGFMWDQYFITCCIKATFPENTAREIEAINGKAEIKQLAFGLSGFWYSWVQHFAKKSRFCSCWENISPSPACESVEIIII